MLGTTWEIKERKRSEIKFLLFGSMKVGGTKFSLFGCTWKRKENK
jgi:hypothetical protein